MPKLGGISDLSGKWTRTKNSEKSSMDILSANSSSNIQFRSSLPTKWASIVWILLNTLKNKIY